MATDERRRIAARDEFQASIVCAYGLVAGKNHYLRKLFIPTTHAVISLDGTHATMLEVRPGGHRYFCVEVPDVRRKDNRLSRRKGPVGGTSVRGLLQTVLLVRGYSHTIAAINATVALIAVVLFARFKSRPPTVHTRTLRRTPSHPLLVRIIDLGIVAFAVSFVLILLLGFAFFMNGRSQSRVYQGRGYFVSNLTVVRVHYQPATGPTDSADGFPTLLASGMVEGHVEWMDLRPYLSSRPHDQFELEDRVPAGTNIPVYFFPDVKGTPRVRFRSGTPPAEQGHRDATDAVHFGVLGLAWCAAILFVLVLLRRWRSTSSSPC